MSYQKDADYNLYFRPGAEAFGYSEGAEAEQRLLDIVEGLDDRSTFAPGYLENIVDWSTRYHFSRAQHYLFSFSGVKTAVLRQAQQLVGKDFSFPSFEIAPLLSEQDKCDLAASFQATAVEILTEKTQLAYRQYQPRAVTISGGVSANQALRTAFEETFPRVIVPDFSYCTDNAAMVATAGYFWAQTHSADNPFKLSIYPNLSVDKL